MAMIVPLPPSMRRLLPYNQHPGLMLDKYPRTWDEERKEVGKLSEAVQKPALEDVVALSAPVPPDWPVWKSRHDQLLAVSGATRFPATTGGPLTLHLSRGSALENAGICLHPLYGFVYLPGTGLKGLAHSFACEVWLPAQPDAQRAFGTICQVFGHSPAPWLNDLAKRHGVRPPDPKSSAAGTVVFHDAWPAAWPKLFVDILNNHHAKYYQGNEPPGDWENPIPVYFLAVPPGQQFEFGVAKRRGDALPEHLHLAVEWLMGGMTKFGVGAKTNAGYGTFQIDASPPNAPGAPQNAERTWSDVRDRLKRRAEFKTTLELITPAFLAGARQDDPTSCELRGATLRGQLRWWWRTLHAGFLDHRTLQDLEAALWGTTTRGSAVRLTVRRVTAERPRPFDKVGLAVRNRLPKPPNNKTTQGLWYHSFGMDDRKEVDGQKVQFRRNYAIPGARWEVSLAARTVRVGERELNADQVLGQAQAALGLLCAYGAVGSKARKGFGCFADFPDFSLDQATAAAEEFRRAVDLARPFDVARAESSALQQRLILPDIPADGWKNYWLLLDQIGDSAQRFAQQHKHRLEKKALGLPRNVRPPLGGSFRPGGPVKDRHASPIHYHIGRTGDGRLVVRAIAFPARYLPDPEASRAFLSKLLDHLKADLPVRLQEHRLAGQQPPQDAGGVAAAAAPVGPPPPKAGDWVETVLLAERTKNGGWKARLKDGPLGGPVTNPNDVPADKKAGDAVTLIIGSINASQIQFRYPTAADQARKPGPPGPKKR